jgi:hypothetical protein
MYMKGYLTECWRVIPYTKLYDLFISSGPAGRQLDSNSQYSIAVSLQMCSDSPFVYEWNGPRLSDPLAHRSHQPTLVTD